MSEGNNDSLVVLPREVVERALECLEDNISYDFSGNPYEEGDELMQTAAANLRAALEHPQGKQRPRYLDGGSRYKVTHLKTSGYCIIGLPEELLGQWVALVDATDNKHMAGHQQPPTTEQSSAVQQPRGEQEPVGKLISDPYEGHIFVPYGDRWPFNEDLYTRPQPKREPLTDEQKVVITRELNRARCLEKRVIGNIELTDRIASAIERAHEIGSGS